MWGSGEIIEAFIKSYLGQANGGFKKRKRSIQQTDNQKENKGAQSKKQHRENKSPERHKKETKRAEQRKTSLD